MDHPESRPASNLRADEPTGNRDTHTSQETLDVLAALNRDDGVTIVLITPNPTSPPAPGASSLCATGC